jgi:hypothetical protein
MNQDHASFSPGWNWATEVARKSRGTLCCPTLSIAQSNIGSARCVSTVGGLVAMAIKGSTMRKDCRDSALRADHGRYRIPPPLAFRMEIHGCWLGCSVHRVRWSSKKRHPSVVLSQRVADCPLQNKSNGKYSNSPYQVHQYLFLGIQYVVPSSIHGLQSERSPHLGWCSSGVYLYI